MPPRVGSRYMFAQAYLDDSGCLLLTDPVPFRYIDLPDNIRHTVTDGETLQTIAGRYYSAKPRGAGLWWIIADFQPQPIVDPTLALQAGTVVIVPSVRTVDQRIFSPSRARSE